MELSKGQTVYVPIYSHIYTSPKSVPSDLTAILSIRNTDLKNSVTVVSVDYYDSEGKLIRQYLKTPLELKAMASTRYIVGTYDKEGGSGANFIVRWRSEKEVNAPLIESVMIGNRGLSFISRGQEISE
ncbi:MAG: DUF3124 domain-containing protein [Nitrospiraceae bacterium]|nr:MAG: DUF3124 domain-containing protein [Nitrospiraceae bacterium]